MVSARAVSSTALCGTWYQLELCPVRLYAVHGISYSCVQYGSIRYMVSAIAVSSTALYGTWYQLELCSVQLYTVHGIS